MTQYAAAKATGASQSYLNQVVNGERLPSADWLETVAQALELSDEERARLHRAAARSHGFKIDLT
jgi:transcriptional regulator with XRE-family HTH domain